LPSGAIFAVLPAACATSPFIRLRGEADLWAAFAFTLSVPLILVGSGLGAFIVWQITVGIIERIRSCRYPKNCAIMITDGFGLHIPELVSRAATCVVGFFFLRSLMESETSPELS
jgi:uncharacterized protein